MSTPPPGWSTAVEPVQPARPESRRQTSPATAWLASNAIFQSLNAGMFGGLIAAWLAIGASLTAATGGALVLCIALPILGWFIGLPIVLGVAMMAAAFWLAGLLAIISAWACVAVTIAAVSFAHRVLASRR